MNDQIQKLKDEEKSSFEDELSYGSESAIQRKDQTPLLAGVALILVGGIFLLSNLTVFSFNNWWAVFILIPAFSNFSRAWRSFQHNGRLTHGGRGALTGGLITLFVASVFLFNLDWGTIWPVFLIIGGVGALLGGVFN